MNNNKAVFLGTGAAELYPNPFCACEVCERSRRGGDLPRKRSAFRLDAKTCIDFGPDVIAASMMYDAPFYDLTDIFITHTHEDHLCFTNINVLTMTPRHDRHIRIWLSPSGVKWVNAYMDANDALYNGRCGIRSLVEGGWISFNALTPYEWHEIGGRRVFAVESNHRGNGENEYALNYIIDSNGIRTMYVCDSGLHGEKNLEALKDFACDRLIMEGTSGSRETPRNASHLNAVHFIENVNNFEKYGVIKPTAEVYVTHINQVNTFSHAQYQTFLGDNCAHRIIVAYDGMKI